jgi:hypothetical protein
MGLVAILCPEVQFKCHPYQRHDGKWLEKQSKLDDWKLWILYDLIQHHVVVNINDCRTGSEEANEVKCVSARAPQQEWKYGKAKTNTR